MKEVKAISTSNIEMYQRDVQDALNSGYKIKYLHTEYVGGDLSTPWCFAMLVRTVYPKVKYAIGLLLGMVLYSIITGWICSLLISEPGAASKMVAAAWFLGSVFGVIAYLALREDEKEKSE